MTGLFASIDNRVIDDFQGLVGPGVFAHKLVANQHVLAGSMLSISPARSSSAVNVFGSWPRHFLLRTNPWRCGMRARHSQILRRR